MGSKILPASPKIPSYFLFLLLCNHTAIPLFLLCVTGPCRALNKGLFGVKKNMKITVRHSLQNPPSLCSSVAWFWHPRTRVQLTYPISSLARHPDSFCLENFQFLSGAFQSLTLSHVVFSLNPTWPEDALILGFHHWLSPCICSLVICHPTSYFWQMEPQSVTEHSCPKGFVFPPHEHIRINDGRALNILTQTWYFLLIYLIPIKLIGV